MTVLPVLTWSHFWMFYCLKWTSILLLVSLSQTKKNCKYTSICFSINFIKIEFISLNINVKFILNEFEIVAITVSLFSFRIFVGNSPNIEFSNLRLRICNSWLYLKLLSKISKISGAFVAELPKLVENTIYTIIYLLFKIINLYNTVIFTWNIHFFKNLFSCNCCKSSGKSRVKIKSKKQEIFGKSRYFLFFSFNF